MFFAVSFQLKLRDSLHMLRDLRSRYTARERVGDASGHPCFVVLFLFSSVYCGAAHSTLFGCLSSGYMV
jgi:hypothetical protein